MGFDVRTESNQPVYITAINVSRVTSVDLLIEIKIFLKISKHRQRQKNVSVFNDQLHLTCPFITRLGTIISFTMFYSYTVITT